MPSRNERKGIRHRPTGGQEYGTFKDSSGTSVSILPGSGTIASGSTPMILFYYRVIQKMGISVFLRDKTFLDSFP